MCPIDFKKTWGGYRYLFIPLDDPKVYDLIKADTSSDVFGLESHMMHACVTMVEPNELRHLIALQSFLKPYMAQKFSEYYKNKEEPDNIEYYSDIEEAILKESYGVLLYCEQAVDMIHQYSRIPIDISNTIVKYIRKNMREELDIWKPFFIFATRMKGYTRSEAEDIWNRIKTKGEWKSGSSMPRSRVQSSARNLTDTRFFQNV